MNYFINANSSRIHQITITYTLTSNLRGNCNPSCNPDDTLGNFSFQINAYTPDGYKPAYMQWVIGVGTPSKGLLFVYLQNYYIQANDGVILWDENPNGVYLPTSAFDTGTTISISPLMNSTGNVLGSNGLIRAANGSVLFNATQLSPVCDHSGYVCNAEAPIVGLEAQLIGDGDENYATFSSATGTISYSSTNTPLTYLSTPVAVTWVQYNGSDGPTPKGTIEKSNLGYGVPA